MLILTALIYYKCCWGCYLILMMVMSNLMLLLWSTCTLYFRSLCSLILTYIVSYKLNQSLIVDLSYRTRLGENQVKN